MQFVQKALAALFGGLLMASSALAQTFPNKPVTLMVPYPAGGVSDVIARTSTWANPSSWKTWAVPVAPLPHKRCSIRRPTGTSFFRAAPMS